MIPENESSFDKPYLLLCEGVGDLRFFHNLFKARSIGTNFSIRHPWREGKYNGGRGNFGIDLANISVSESFIENTKAVLVVSDNDEDQAASFEQVKGELKKAGNFGIPDAAGIVSTQSNSHKVVVLMLPIGRKGNLETLCLEAAYSKWPLQQNLDEFVKKCPANDWNISKQSKMRLQTILAATNKKRPDTGFAGHWNSESDYLIPLDHACFDELANFIRNFESLLLS
jgi:hypothetical protein